MPAATEINKKWIIFWSVTFVFALLEAVAGYIQVSIVKRDESLGLIGENELPDVVMLILNITSSIMLYISI